MAQRRPVQAGSAESPHLHAGWVQDGTSLHPTDEHVEVKQGTFLVGLGDKFDLRKATPMAVGDTGTAPAGMHHYAAAKGATIVSLTMMGPYVMTYVNPHDEPWGTFPYGYSR